MQDNCANNPGCANKGGSNYPGSTVHVFTTLNTKGYTTLFALQVFNYIRKMH